MKMKKIMILLLMAICVLGLSGCTHSMATFMAESYNDNTFDLTFESFDGEKDCYMDVPKKSDGVLNYSGSIESGSITVYYKSGGSKKELMTLNGKDSTTGSIDGIKKSGLKLYFETDGECTNGDFSFEIE